MASTDRDDNPRRSVTQEDSKNPFVRFKHFADAQASIALQGLQSIIGLPSAFVKHGPEHNGRWATWDEEAKSKVTLEGQQTRLRDTGTQTDQVVAPQYPAVQTTEAEPTNNRNSGMDDEGEENGPDLYMAMSSDVIDRYMYRQVGDGWSNAFHTPRTMSMIQSMVLGAMTFSHTKGTQDEDTSYTTPSVLPYLLFSSYSPLQLKCQAAQNSHLLQQFHFEAAFEDLLLASQGKPMVDLHETPRAITNAPMTPFKSPLPFFLGDSGFGYQQMDSLFGDIDRAISGMRWLGKLDESRLLGTTPRTFIKPVMAIREALPMWTAGNGVASDVFREIMAIGNDSMNSRALSDFFGTATASRNAESNSVTKDDATRARDVKSLEEKITKDWSNLPGLSHIGLNGGEDVENDTNNFDHSTLPQKQVDANHEPGWYGRRTPGTNTLSRPEAYISSKRESFDDSTEPDGSILTRSKTETNYTDGTVVVTTSKDWIRPDGSIVTGSRTATKYANGSVVVTKSTTTRPVAEEHSGFSPAQRSSKTSGLTTSSSVTSGTGDGPSTEEELYRQMGVTLDNAEASDEKNERAKDSMSKRRGWFWE